MRMNTARHYAENPETFRLRNQARVLMEKEASGQFTDQDIQAIRRELKDRCNYCGIPLHGEGQIDHITPLIRGGSNDPENLTLACDRCNKEKHGKTLHEYIKWRQGRGLPIKHLLEL